MRTLLFIFFMFFGILVYSQNRNNVKKVEYENVYINLYTVIDDKLYTQLLESLLKNESKCLYYSDTLYYGIQIGKTPIANTKDSVIFLKILGHDKKEFFLKKNELLGCFSYKAHTFFVLGYNILNPIKKTNNKKLFKYNKNFSFDEDDRWTIYWYLYYNDDFIFYEKENDFLCRGTVIPSNNRQCTILELFHLIKTNIKKINSTNTAVKTKNENN